MRQFAELTASLASELIAREAALPSWMIQAREALLSFNAEFEPFLPTETQKGETLPLEEAEESALLPAKALVVERFFARLNAIADWPQESALLEGLLGAAAPVIDFASRSFFSETETASGAGVGVLWRDQARVIVKDGHARYAFDTPNTPFHSVSSKSAFERSDWSADAPAGSRSGDPYSIDQDRMAVVFAAIANSIDLNPAAPGEPEGADSSQAIAKNLASSLFSLPGSRARTLLSEAAVFRYQLPAAPAPARSPLASESASEHFLRRIEERFSSHSSLGERAGLLYSAVCQLPELALERARGDAHARFGAFLDQRCPNLQIAADVSRRMWGASLSLEAALSASAWAPIAAQLEQEDPRGARLAFALAPALNIAPSASMLSETKAALKKLGFNDAVWRELSKIPLDDFASLLMLFKIAANKTVARQGALARDPFAPAPLPPQQASPSSDKTPNAPPVSAAIRTRALPFSFDSAGLAALQATPEAAVRNLARRCALSFEVARQSGVPFELASSFFMSEDPLGSPAWRSRQAQDQKPSEAGAIASPALRVLKRSEPAAYELASFCLIERGAESDKEQAPARWRMEQAESEAAGAKSAVILGLALKEALKRPFDDVMREMKDLNDWFTRSEPGLWQALPEKMTWASLRRREAAWHEELAVAKDAQLKSPWAPILEQPVACGELFAVELKTGLDLLEEGRRMKHCVSSYAQDCREGTCRIYSIRNAEGDSLATLEARLACDPANPTAAPVPVGRQLRGPCNGVVPSESPEGLAAQAAIEALNRAATSAFKAQAPAELAPTFTDFHAALAARRGALPPAQSLPSPSAP